MYDVVTFGEAMVRLSPPIFKDWSRLEVSTLCGWGGIECGCGRNPPRNEEHMGI